MRATQAVHLLLFSERELSFGVYAEQVKELLKTEPRSPKEYNDSGWTVPYKGRELQVTCLSSRLKLWGAMESSREFLYRQDLGLGEEAVAAEQEDDTGLGPSARILVVRHCQEGEIGIYVECLKQLSLVPLSRIFRLPFVMERKRLTQSVWGLALIDERPVVLIDFEHM